MVDAVVPAPKIELSEQPNAHVTSAVFDRPMPVGLGTGLSELGQGAEDMAGDLARQQAQTDLQNQKVTLAADGSVQMANPSNSIILGRAGDEYNQAMNAGYTAELGNDVRARMQSIHLQFPADPVGFQKAADSYVAAVRANTTLGPAVGNALGNIADNEATQHLDNIKEKSFELGARASLGNIQTEISVTQNKMRAIARQSGVDDPGYLQLQANLTHSYNNLKDAGRIFGYSPERADSELQTSLSIDRGEAVLGNVERVFQRTGGDGGRAGAQQYLKTLDDPSLNLPIEERDRLKQQGMAHLAYLTSDQKAQIDANRVGTNALLDQYRIDPTKITEQMFGQAITQARSVGDAESVLKLQYAHDTASTSQALMRLPDDQRIMAMTGNDYLSKVAMKEGGGRADPGGNGGGMFQFEPKTWQGLMASHPDLNLTPGGATDPAQASRAAVALTNDNKAALQSAGIAPTDANTYMAHFLGAGGATSFIKAMNANPNAPAAGINLAAATANPSIFYKPGANGKPDPSQPRSLQEVYALQTKTFGDGTTPVVAPGVNGAPTQAQMQANPFALPMYVQSLKTASDDEIKTAKNVGSALDQQFSQGNVPPAQVTGAYLQLADRHPNELGEQAQKVRNYYEGASAGAYANTLPEPQRQAYAAQVAAVLANPTDLNAMGKAEEVQRVMAKGATNLKTDPFNEAARRGWITRPPMQPDFSQPQTVPQAILERSQAAGAIASFNKTPEVPIFAPAELGQITSIMRDGPIDARLSLLSSITNARLPQPILNATLRQLGSDDATRPLAVAGDVARDNPIVARNILQGQALMQTDKDLAPNKDDFPTAFAKALPFNDLGGDARKGYDSAIQALYAQRSAAANDTSGVLNQTRLDDAIRDVTGGVLEWRGGKAIAPWYGATQEQFDAAVRSVTDADLANSRGADGIPLPASALKPSLAGVFNDGSRWRLQSYGPGKYMIYSGADDGRQYLRDTSGKNFVLDLGSKRAQAEAGSLEMPSSLFYQPNFRWYDAPGPLGPAN